jgi:hypothetical protein
MLVGCATAGVRPSWKGHVSPVNRALAALCKATPEPVSVAIYGEMQSIVTDEASVKQGIDPERLRNAARNDTQTKIEQELLEAMAAYKNFRLVDRMTVNRLFEEIKFGLTGALSPDIRVRIGEMSGATHLILFSNTYYPADQSMTLTTRLIVLETGQVLASQSAKRFL